MRTRCRAALLSFTLIFATVVGSFAKAQQRPGEGLDSLSDDALLDELAARGMDALLEHAFAVNKVPKSRQDAVRTLVALRRLGDPSAKLTAAQRQKLLGDIVRGIEDALASMRDPRLMMRQAADLIAAGVERDVNTLEYWGENPRTQAQLRPVVQTVVKLLNRCAEVANAQADEAANRIKSPDDKPAIQRYEQLEQLARDAEYTRHMADYYLVLATDRADRQRNQIAGKAIEYLKQFDAPDQPIRARVRNRIGKLAMASGDFDTARATFDAVINGAPTDYPSGAAPDAGLQYEARYFRAVTDLLAYKPDDAMRGLESLEAWQAANLPNPAAAANADAKARAQSAQEGAAAAAAMLRYRILSQQAEGARDPAQRKQLADQATAALLQLLRQQPGLQNVIYEQLAGRMSENADVANLDVLLLQALVRRGENEVRRGDAAPVDTRTLEQALAAARELARRSSGVDPQIADSAALLAGYFLDRLDRDADATAAFLDYVQRDPQSRNATPALDNAQALLGQLRRDRSDDPAVVQLYERFLPLAIAPPFNRKQFAYEYARRLQLQGKAKQAVEYFEQVPDDERRAIAAHFFQTIALQQQLDEMRPDDPQRAALVGQIQQLANQVRGSISAALATATTDDERNNFRSMLVRTTLLAAEMAREEQDDPTRALQLLENFERSLQGLPDAARRTTDALLVRVQALMALNRYDEATAQLVQLLDREPARGGRIVYDLLERLNAELDKAQAAGDGQRVRTVAQNRARLTGFLVKWAQDNPNEALRKLAYSYRVFDAEVQRFAAVQEADAAAREAGLRRALDLFVNLNTPEGAAQYKASLPPELTAEAGDVPYDPTVVLGLARTQFDLGQYQEARDSFSRLLNDRRLGPPVMTVEDHGQPRETDNENYWEAVLKLIRSNLALNSGIEESKNYLKQQLVRWGERVGGRKWKAEFDKLRNEIIPGYDPNVLTPSTAPTTTVTGDAGT